MTDTQLETAALALGYQSGEYVADVLGLESKPWRFENWPVEDLIAYVGGPYAHLSIIGGPNDE